MSNFGTGRADVGRHIGYRADHIGYGPVLLLSHRPVMFRAARGTMGEGTARGRAFTGMWRYADFRPGIFRVTTVVSGWYCWPNAFSPNRVRLPKVLFLGPRPKTDKPTGDRAGARQRRRCCGR